MARAAYRQPPYLFERVMFWVMVPGLVAPLAAAVAITLIRFAPQVDGARTDGMSLIVVMSFLWILLGSELLRSWLWIRHPLMRVSPMLPRASAVARAILLALTVVLAVTFLPGWPAAATITVGLAIAILAVYDHSLILRRPAIAGVRSTDPRPAFVMWVPPVLAVIATAALITGLVGVRLGNVVVALVGSLTLGALALPWTHPIATFLVLFGMQSRFPESPLWILAAVAMSNIALLWSMAASDASYQRAVNWFFRLKATAEPPAPL